VQSKFARSANVNFFKSRKNERSKLVILGRKKAKFYNKLRAKQVRTLSTSYGDIALRTAIVDFFNPRRGLKKKPKKL